MGLLVGLPLTIFALVFLLLRLAWPLLLLVLIVWLVVRKLRGRAAPPPTEPDFDGPVVEVDYQVVDEDKEG